MLNGRNSARPLLLIFFAGAVILTIGELMGDHEMKPPKSMGQPSDEAAGNDPASPLAGASGINHDSNASHSRPESPLAETPPSDADTKPTAPMQKRRRVTRACDECRRKKIKCDGKQPCTHCTVYSYGVSLGATCGACAGFENSWLTCNARMYL